MSGSSYRSQMIVDLMPKLRLYLNADTSSSDVIQPGDLLEMKLADKTVILMDDDQPTSSSYKFIGISNSYWDPKMNDALLKKTIEVIGFCIVHAIMDSGTYVIGEAVEYSVASDDGHLKSWQTGNQVVGWIWDVDPTQAVTGAHVLINVLDPSCKLLEVYS